jgi:hypothetical protein
MFLMEGDTNLLKVSREQVQPFGNSTELDGIPAPRKKKVTAKIKISIPWDLRQMKQTEVIGDAHHLTQLFACPHLAVIDCPYIQ